MRALRRGSAGAPARRSALIFAEPNHWHVSAAPPSHQRSSAAASARCRRSREDCSSRVQRLRPASAFGGPGQAEQWQSLLSRRLEPLLRRLQALMVLPVQLHQSGREQPNQQQQQQQLAAVAVAAPSIQQELAEPAAAGSSGSSGSGPPEIDDEFAVQRLSEHISALAAYGQGTPELRERAVAAAEAIRELVSAAVNTKHKGLRALQASLVGAGVVPPLVTLGQQGHAIAFEALQILCYRNNVTCKQVAAAGIVETIAQTLTSDASQDMELQSAMCFLLTGLVAFCEATHQRVMALGLVPQLVALCRTRTSVGQRQATLQTRAAAVLRNLSHNPKNHALLINAGAVDALVDVIHKEKDPASRINAAVGVACLVGHEEGNPKLQLSEDLVVDMLQVLDAACVGSMKYGTFWTVWKLCQGLASLSVNDRNKELITSHRGVLILSKVLRGRHHSNETAHRFALSALWNLAFSDAGKQAIVAAPGLVDAIRATLLTTENARTKEAAKGALWTLGLEEDVRSLHDGRVPGSGSGAGAAASSGGASAGDAAAASATEAAAGGAAQQLQQAAATVAAVPHVMLSYEWGCQQSVMLIKTELQKAGYATWMDIDKMSGSTLEAMARAVEDSAAVIVCVSKRYKESQACRTEAEYAFQQRKKIIPVLMERDYKPSGWLGALMGTRLYFLLHDPRQIPTKMPQVVKELGDAGRLLAGPSSSSSSSGSTSSSSAQGTTAAAKGRADGWTLAEVEAWLRRIRCDEHVPAFRDKDIDGPALSGLYRLATDAAFLHQVLQHELGVSTLGQRLRLVEELHRLFT